MGGMKVLYISGSIGLGHVTRDLSIVGELRKRRKDIEIVWIADQPVCSYLREKGERVLPALEGIEVTPNDLCDARAKDYHMNLYPWWLEWYKTFPERVEAINRAAEREGVDLIVGDEAYDLYCEFQKHPKLKQRPFLLMLDFIGGHRHDGIWKGRNPLPLWFFHKWTYDHVRDSHDNEGTILIGEADDVVDESLGLLLPNRREVARRYMDCVGYSLTFDPSTVADRDALRKKLGYGPGPLILVTIGGTAAAAPLLRRAAEAYPLLKRKWPNLQMVLVGGPRVQEGYVQPQDGLSFRGLVLDLYEHMAAADLTICAGGGTTTLELQALNKPFIYFPIEDHFEQQIDVAYHLERDRVGRRMSFDHSDAEQLAAAVVEEMQRRVQYPRLRLDGARLAAEHIDAVLKRIEKGELKSAS